MPRMQPSAGSGVRRIGEARPQTAGRTINLTGSAHDAAPSLDDGQRGPQGAGQDRSAEARAASVGAGDHGPARRARPGQPLAFRARGAAAAARPGCDAAAGRRLGQTRRADDQEEARRQKRRDRFHRRARDARPARAQEAARDARQGAAQDRDHHAQGLQARGAHHRGRHRRRTRRATWASRPARSSRS